MLVLLLVVQELEVVAEQVLVKTLLVEEVLLAVEAQQARAGLGRERYLA